MKWTKLNNVEFDLAASENGRVTINCGKFQVKNDANEAQVQKRSVKPKCDGHSCNIMGVGGADPGES